jgi:basic amino acid/polyamine antiporter, APA family
MSTNAQAPKIGLAVATIVGMNAMIGSGIFSIPAALASNVGPAGILTFAFVIISVWCMGSSIARLAQLYPQEGSFYIYTKQWAGHVGGLISAGSYLIGLIIAMGLLGKVAGAYLHTPLPFLSAFQWGIITIITFTILNMIGVVLSEAGQMILICTTVFPLIATILLCFSKADFANLIPFMPYGFINVFAATKAVIFAFFGFECAASLYNVVENPKKNVSKALTLTITLVGTLYMLFVVSLILAVPLRYFISEAPLPDILHKIFPENRWIITTIHLSILSAVLGTIHSMLWSSSALLLSYLKQFKNKTINQLIQKETLNQRMAVAIIGLCILTTFLTLKDFNLFISATAFFIVFAYATSIITLLTLKEEWKSTVEITKTIVGLLTAGVIFYFALEGIIINLFN